MASNAGPSFTTTGTNANTANTNPDFAWTTSWAQTELPDPPRDFLLGLSIGCLVVTTLFAWLYQRWVRKLL